MKYPTFSLLSFCLFLLAACQQNSPGSSSDAGVPASSDPATLNQQILEEMIEGRKLSRQFDSTFVQYRDLSKFIGENYNNLGPDEQEQVSNIRKTMKLFTEPYVMVDVYATQLDTLSGRLHSGLASLEEAQKEFTNVRKQMRSEMEKLSNAPVSDLPKYKAEIEKIVAGANQ